MPVTLLRVTPVALVLAIIYGALGLTYVPASGAREIVLPVGIIAPWFISTLTCTWHRRLTF